MLAKHDPWLNFGLWAVLVGLLNFSVICGLKQEQVSLLLAIPAMAVSFVCSAIVLASFFIGAKQQSYFNRHKVELELNNKEEWLLHAGAFIITALIGICIIIALGSLLWYSISCVTDWGKKGLFFILLLFLISIYFFFLWRRRSNEKTKLDETLNKNNMDRSINFHQGNQYERSQETSSYVDESRPATIAIIYKSEIDYISRCILDFPNIETGGQLFGFWTTEGIPVVLYAIGPGPNSEHHVVHFVQDPQYLERVGNVLINKFGLQHIGEWHSHHQLGLAKPSGQDAFNMTHIIEQFSFRHFLLCIGNCSDTQSTLNAFTFHINNPRDYVQARWEIKDIDSPFRALIDAEFGDLLIHPIKQEASLGHLFVVGNHNTTVIPNYGADYWLNIKENNKILKDIIDYIKTNEGFNVNIQMDKNRIVHLFLTKPGIRKHVVFPERFPYVSPSIETVVDNEAFIDERLVGSEVVPNWEYSGDIYNSFINFYKYY